MCMEANFNSECQFIPGYTGFCPEAEQHIGSSYGRITQEVITGRHNYLTSRLSPTKCYPDGCLKPTICDRYIKTSSDRKGNEKIEEFKTDQYFCNGPSYITSSDGKGNEKIEEFKTDRYFCNGPSYITSSDGKGNEKIEEFKTDRYFCNSPHCDFEIFRPPESNNFPDRFRSTFTNHYPQIRRKFPDCQQYRYTSEFRPADVTCEGGIRKSRTEFPSENENARYKTDDKPVERQRARFKTEDKPVERENAKFKTEHRTVEKERNQTKKSKIVGDSNANPCDGYCQRINYGKMRAAGLPSDWEDVKETIKLKQKEKEHYALIHPEMGAGESKTKPGRPYRACQNYYSQPNNIKHHHDDFSMLENYQNRHFRPTEKAETTELAQEEGYPVSLTIHLPKCKSEDKIEIPKIHRGYKSETKNYCSHDSPCRQKRNMGYYPEKQKVTHMQKSSNESGCPYLNSMYAQDEQESSAKPRSSQPTNVTTRSAAYRKCSPPKCASNCAKVIPKYTGYIQGLRWTYGETYGKAADRLLGKRPECLEKYVVCDNYVTHPVSYCYSSYK